MIEAKVLEIERFALHDGPGIRTVVFLQGCPLHCPWCSNPESQASASQLMHSDLRCVGCGRCAVVCPSGCISFVPGALPSFDREICSACGVCRDNCPSGAIRIVPQVLDCDSVLATVLRDKDYYLASRGGVTFSGGEALMQPEALSYMLRRCKEEGLHTAVETCGNVPESYLDEVLPYADLFLFDLKHTDAARFHEVTGGHLDLVMRNLAKAAASAKLRLRIPCIPGFNLEDSFFEEAFRIAVSLGISGVDLLPYHTLGQGKYKELGRGYTMDVQALHAEELNEYVLSGSKLGLDVKIMH